MQIRVRAHDKWVLKNVGCTIGLFDHCDDASRAHAVARPVPAAVRTLAALKRCPGWSIPQTMYIDPSLATWTHLR